MGIHDSKGIDENVSGEIILMELSESNGFIDNLQTKPLVQGLYDLFILSIDPESGELNWSKSLGSKNINYWGQDVVADEQGSIFVAGDN